MIRNQTDWIFVFRNYFLFNNWYFKKKLFESEQVPILKYTEVYEGSFKCIVKINWHVSGSLSLYDEGVAHTLGVHCMQMSMHKDVIKYMRPLEFLERNLDLKLQRHHNDNKSNQNETIFTQFQLSFTHRVISWITSLLCLYVWIKLVVIFSDVQFSVLDYRSLTVQAYLLISVFKATVFNFNGSCARWFLKIPNTEFCYHITLD